jgi:hypothetical protein
MSEHERVPLPHLGKPWGVYRSDQNAQAEDIPEDYRTLYYYTMPLKKEVLRSDFTLLKVLKCVPVCRYFHGFVYSSYDKQRENSLERRLAVRPDFPQAVFLVPHDWCTTEEEAFQKLNHEVNNKKELLNRKIERLQTRLQGLEHYHSLLLQKR